MTASSTSGAPTSPNEGLPFVVIGHPGHRRVTLFQEALARLGLPPAQLVAWRDLLRGSADLDAVLGEGAVVRLESPGQDFEVEKLLLAAGAEVEETEDTQASYLPKEEALRLEPDHGLLLYPRQWYRGLRATLLGLARRLTGRPGVRWMSHPEEVSTLFDKRRCQALLQEAGVSIPRRLGPAGSFEELVERLRQAGTSRAFVKLACGSCASGAVAFRSSGPLMQAITTAELVRQGGAWRIYNSRRIRTYERPGEVEVLLDLLCREGVQVEEWLPRVEWRGRGCDLRVLVIAGEPRHTVVRMSESPFSNLHLLNERDDGAALQATVEPASWKAAMASCASGAGVVGRCWHVGVDLLFTPLFRRHAVLEMNAFGDLLPGTLCNGLDTHTAELAAWLQGTSREGEPGSSVPGV